MLALDVDDDN